MPGFSTVDAIVSRLSVDLAGQRLLIHKTGSTMVASTPHSLWAATGLPSAGGYGSVGKANGRVLTSSTTGALSYSNPSAPNTMHLLKSELTLVAGSVGTIIVVDRIADVLLAHAEATGSITGVDATSRLPSGAGCQLWLEVQTALSAASNTWTFGYTNQAGTSSRTTGSIVTVASAIVNRSPTAALWQPLQAGDTGIRTLDSITLVSGTATGQICAALVRPLATIPLPTLGLSTARDHVMELPQLERVRDNSCIQLIYVPNTTTALTVAGELLICDN